MSDFVQKKFWISAETAEKIEAESKALGVSQSELVRERLSIFSQPKTELENAQGEAPKTKSGNGFDEERARILLQQLAVKDEQISKLTEALLNAQESAKAAQVLHAADAMPQAFESEPQKEEEREERKSRWRRLVDAWRG